MEEITVAEIIVLNDYRREHGIALPRSPYYTLKATKRDLDMALERAAKMMNEPLDKQGLLPYAVIVGYENKKTGDIKLLKEYRLFSNKEAFASMAGIRGHYSLGLMQEAHY